MKIVSWAVYYEKGNNKGYVKNGNGEPKLFPTKKMLITEMSEFLDDDDYTIEKIEQCVSGTVEAKREEYNICTIRQIWNHKEHKRELLVEDLQHGCVDKRVKNIDELVEVLKKDFLIDQLFK